MPIIETTTKTKATLRSGMDELAQATQTDPLALSSVQNTFPVEVFPQPIQDFINSANENLGFPIDYTGAAVISAVGLAIGNSHQLSVKNRWKEKANFYMVLVGNRGEYKTHSINLAYHPIKVMDGRNSAKYDTELKEYKRALQEFKASDKKAATEPIEPIRKRRTVKDYTIEALYDALKHNGAIGVVQDELKGWFGNFDRYNKGSEAAFWLDGFSCDNLDILRKVASSAYLLSPFIGMMGGTQIEVLPELAKDGRDKNGLTDRLLFAFPEFIEQSVWRDNDISDTILNGYTNIINRLLELPINTNNEGVIIPIELHNSPEAMSVYEKWYNQNGEMRASAPTANIAAIYAKLEVYTFRFALVLQMLKYACNTGNNTQIDLQSMQGAIKLTEYFRRTALRAAAAMSLKDPLGAQAQNVKDFYNRLPEKFTTAEAQKIGNEMKVSPTDTEAAHTKTITRILSNESLFKRISTGHYEKLI